MSESESIKVIYDGAIVRLVLNRPKQLNALNDDIRKVIASTLNDLMELRGTGRQEEIEPPLGSGYWSSWIEFLR